MEVQYILYLLSFHNFKALCSYISEKYNNYELFFIMQAILQIQMLREQAIIYIISILTHGFGQDVNLVVSNLYTGTSSWDGNFKISK